jgi:outer membrane protein assembly factor BamB
MYRDDPTEERPILVVAFNGRVYGKDPRTGVTHWEHQLEGMGHTQVELTFSRGRIYASNGYTVACFAYPTGERLGTTQVPGSYRGRPTMLVEGDYLYLATNGELSCFDRDGKLVWHDPFPGKGLGSVALGFPGNVRQSDNVGSH